MRNSYDLYNEALEGVSDAIRLAIESRFLNYLERGCDKKSARIHAITDIRKELEQAKDRCDELFREEWYARFE